MKAVVAAFNQEKALVGAFSVIAQPVVEPMDRFTALFRKFISEPVMVPRYNISLEEERELALRRLQRICDNKEWLQQTNPRLM